MAALSHFKDPARVEWIASISMVPERQAITVCKDLLDRAIVRTDTDAQLFELPRLAGQFFQEQCREAVAVTGARLADLVFGMAVEIGRDNFQRNEEIEAQWSVVAAAIPLLVKADNSRLQKFCASIVRFLEFSGRWDEATFLAAQGEEIARAHADYLAASRRACQLGLDRASPSEFVGGLEMCGQSPGIPCQNWCIRG